MMKLATIAVVFMLYLLFFVHPSKAHDFWINGRMVDPRESIKPKALDTDDKSTVTFTKAGEIDYFCGLHPDMTGKIIVTP
jgi:plastocyanin